MTVFTTTCFQTFTICSQSLSSANLRLQKLLLLARGGNNVQHTNDKEAIEIYRAAISSASSGSLVVI